MNPKSILIWSLVVGFIGCNLWPFLWYDVYYHCQAAQKLLVAAALIRLSEPYLKLHRIAWINLCIAGLDAIKELRKTLIFVTFDPQAFELYEYIFAAVIIIVCLLGYRGLFKIILLLYLNLTYPNSLKCRRKNLTYIAYQLKADSKFLSLGWPV